MSEILDKLAKKATEDGMDIYRIAEMTDSGIEAVDLHRGNAAHDCYSIAKTFSSVAIGILNDRGVVSPDDEIYPILEKYFPENFDPKWKSVTIEDVFQHRTGAANGVDFDTMNLLDFHASDTLTYLLSERLVYERGERLVYSDGSYYIISRIVSELTGEDLEKFLMKELFVPLDFHVYAWSRCPLGYTLGGTGLFCRTEDLVKLGWLYLNRGVYGNKRVFSENWADYIYGKKHTTAKRVSFSVAGFDYGVYHMNGAFGQCVMFDPDKRRAIAYHACGKADLLEYYSQIR